MKVVNLSFLLFSTALVSPVTSNGDADYASNKEGNLRSLQSDYVVRAPVSCQTCPCGFNDGCNGCGCDENGFPFCTLRFCFPEDLGEPSCNKCADSCCDLSDRPQGAIEAPLCCPDGTWVGNIGDGSGTCPNGEVVSSRRGNEGLVCQPTCSDCPCGYNDGCNDCTCGPNGSAACTERACLVQGTPFCKECPASDKCCDPRQEPGVFGNPPSREGHQCCGVTGEWVGSIGDGRTIFCGNQLISSGYGESCPDESKCCDIADRPLGGFEAPLCCPDGLWVGNIGDGSGTCADGSIVLGGRNEGDICALTCDDCPCGFNDGCNTCGCNEDGFAICTLRACFPGELGEPSCNRCEGKCCDLADRSIGDIEAPLCCRDGTWAGNIGDGTGTCADGSVVASRTSEGDICAPTCESCPCGYNDGCNDCTCGRGGNLLGCTDLACLLQGPPSCNECEQVFCTQDVKTCPDGSFVGRDSDNGCSFFPCPPDEILCTQDIQTCPDGSSVGRDPDSDCSFFPCPVLECPARRRFCWWTRRWVRLDPNRNCQVFFPCYWWH